MAYTLTLDELNARIVEMQKAAAEMEKGDRYCPVCRTVKERRYLVETNLVAQSRCYCDYDD